MLMMRLQRVGRKNDPAYRIVVTDKRTGVKSDKHVDRIGSYNPKMGTIILDKEKAKQWLSQGVQASGTMHNILVSQGVIDAKKINVLPRKSPIVDPEAIKKAEEAAAAKLEAEKAAAEEKAAADAAPAEEVVEETPEAEVTKEVAETPAEEPVVEEAAPEAETPAEVEEDPKA
ncbi:MAG: small subunit ribosomal protein S16 [Candidatus Paceibacteria bacterium]|jgi:small subunit ribosomal protein S16